MRYNNQRQICTLWYGKGREEMVLRGKGGTREGKEEPKMEGKEEEM